LEAIMIQKLPKKTDTRQSSTFLLN
jgi:hypothetical protein